MLLYTFFIWGVISTNIYGVLNNEPAKTEYLTEVMLERVPYVKQGWGKLGINTATHAPDKEPMLLRINDKEYGKGLGTHAPGEIIVELDGEYEAFEAEIGVQKQFGDNVGSVVFQVFVDDEKRFDSGVIRELDPAQPIRISLSDAQEMRLAVTDAGDGITCDCANWANARLTRSDAIIAKTPVSPLDIARFAQVITSDPNRNDGCRNNRVQEFPAEDIFLESEILPDPNGIYSVPINEDGMGCIGLKWFESRSIKKAILQFSDDSYIPSLDDIKIQGWFGESRWQGNWKPLNGTMEQEDKQFIFNMNPQAEGDLHSAGTEKLRWIFPKSPQPIIISGLSAFTLSRWNISDFRIELEHPQNGKYGEIEIYNGFIIESDKSNTRFSWDLSKAVNLKLLYNRSRSAKSDRTVVIIRLPENSLGIAINDVIVNGCVYVPDTVFMTPEPAKYSLAEYQDMIANRETILQKVRKMPDQTFEQAMEKVHRDIQDNGPTMLSLACDNNKFIVQREGAIRFGNFDLTPQMGSGKNKQIKRYLYGHWLPVPVTSSHEDGILYEQRTFVVPYDKTDTRLWLNNKPLCVGEFTIKNESSDETDTSLILNFVSDTEKKEAAQVRQESSGIVIYSGDRLLAYVSIDNTDALKTEMQDGLLTLKGKMPGQAQLRFYIYIPAWEMKSDEYNSLTGGDNLISDLEDYWKRILAPTMQIEIPDQYLLNVIRASQVHCLMAARNDFDGKLVQPWIASMAYGPLESEAHSIVRGMGLMGHQDFAQHGLDFFIYRYNPAGYLTTGYTLMGTGWHLWTLAELYELTHDSDWLRSNAPKIAKVCSWIAQQLEKTKKLDARGEKYPEYGLMPPGVVADWNRFAYRTYMEGHYFAGLYGATKALADIDYPDADLLHQKALEFRDNFLRAYRWTQERSPVLPLSDGTWVLPYPGMIYCFGFAGDMFPGEDWNRTWAGDVEIGSHHLVPLGIIDPDSQETEWITEHMEDFWFLKSGMGEYTEEENKADWFNLGGFAKVQPYYGRITEIYAMRDDVKPFIRSYFNAIPSLLNTENLSFWEHFHNIGAWNKTHETGSFLQQTRFMFVMEKDDDLWLAPFVTDNWMKDGMVVDIKNAPTRFGNVSYRITSSVDKGFIDAVIEPTKYAQPKELVIRLRHPEGKTIQRVIVNGMVSKNFDSVMERIFIRPTKDTINIRAEY